MTKFHDKKFSVALKGPKGYTRTFPASVRKTCSCGRFAERGSESCWVCKKDGPETQQPDGSYLRGKKHA